MRPTWLIEAGVYGAEVDPLLAEIRRQGMSAECIPHAGLKKGATPVVDGRALGDGSCVIGYGTFPFARQIHIHHRWVPGAWCTPENLDCAAYYAHFGKFLLNDRYTLLPGVEAIRQADWLFSIFANHDEREQMAEVFIRPSGCQKLFVGRRVCREEFRHALGPARYDPQTLIVVAPIQPIEREWRVIVCDGHVIAGSQYAANGCKDIVADFPEEVRAFADRILAEIRWRPDPVFMLDICESRGALRLVELNSFSSSWLYACDLAEVVDHVSALAGRN